MKKIYLLLGSLSLLLSNSFSQTLNDPANWPNASWTVGGTYTASALLNDPTVDPNFTFDDDAAGSGSTDAIFVESPVIDLTAAAGNGELYLSINFDYVFNDGFNASEFLNVEYWDDDAGSWMVVEALVANSTSTADYINCDGQVSFESELIDISSFTANQLSNFQYRINYDDATSWAYGFCIGSPTIMSLSCPDPSDLTLDAVGGTDATVSWTENGSSSDWNIEWGATGFVPGTGAEDGSVATTNNPETITGLTPSTTYDVYVQTDCGGGNGQSVWVGPLEITTADACSEPINLTADILSSTEVDFSWEELGTSTEWNIEYGFSGFTPGTGAEEGFINNTTNLSEVISGLTTGEEYDFYVNSDCGGTPSGWSGPVTVDLSYCLPSYSSTIDYLSLFETAFAVENVSYTASSQPAGGYEDLTETDTLKAIEGSTVDFETNYVGGSNTIRIWADWNNNLVFEAGEELFYQGVSFSSPDNPQFGSITIPGGTTAGSYRMRVRSEFGSTSNPGPCTAETYGSTIDLTIEVLPVPSCPSISDLMVSNVTTDGAEISWTIGDSETEWIIEYDTIGFVQGTGNTLVTSNNPETLTGLMSNTGYDVYVRAICAAGDTSYYFGPVSFATECNVFSALDFCESFDSDSQSQSCWTVLDENGDGETWNMDYGSNPNSGDETAVLYTDGNGGANDDWLITPQISLSSNEVMSFFYRVQSDFEPNDFEVLLSTTGKNPADFDQTLMDLASYDNENYLDTTVDLTAYSGDVYIAFHVPSGGPDGWRLYIDDVCFNVCNPNPGTDGATDVCRADETVNLNSIIVKGEETGSWSFPGNQQLIVDDSLFNVSTLPADDYDVLYIVEGGCSTDTTIATITVFPPSSAGQNGSLEVCQNEPVNLFDGLSGNVDLGGTWYDPSDDPIAGSQPVASSIPGSYNFDYITSNGVCPADTALVEVVVRVDCDWLSIGEEKLNELSVFPNPATDVINISNPSNSESLRVEILDMNGRVVLTDAKALANATEGSINVGHLVKGMYTLRVYNEESQKTFRVVIQ